MFLKALEIFLGDERFFLPTPDAFRVIETASSLCTWCKNPMYMIQLTEFVEWLVQEIRSCYS